jgi:hypothetical protein
LKKASLISFSVPDGRHFFKAADANNGPKRRKGRSSIALLRAGWLDTQKSGRGNYRRDMITSEVWTRESRVAL